MNLKALVRFLLLRAVYSVESAYLEKLKKKLKKDKQVTIDLKSKTETKTYTLKKYAGGGSFSYVFEGNLASAPSESFALKMIPFDSVRRGEMAKKEFDRMESGELDLEGIFSYKFSKIRNSEDERCFKVIVMEWAKGGNLQDLLIRIGKNTEASGQDIDCILRFAALALSEKLDALNEKLKMPYMDMKGENVLLMSELTDEEMLSKVKEPNGLLEWFRQNLRIGDIGYGGSAGSVLPELTPACMPSRLFNPEKRADLERKGQEEVTSIDPQVVLFNAVVHLMEEVPSYPCAGEIKNLMKLKREYWKGGGGKMMEARKSAMEKRKSVLAY